MENLNREAILKYLPTGHKFEITVLNETDSTNNCIKRLSRPENGAVFIAERQTAGRGRRGNSFYSPSGVGIYMSVFADKKLLCDDVGLVTSCVAVAVATAVDDLCGTHCGIKWVNDIFLNGKKLCGILCEVISKQCDGEKIEGCVIGIGINVLNFAVPKELQNTVTSIENETGKAVSRNLLAAKIIDCLFTLLENCKSGEFLNESRKRSVILGKEITVEAGSECFTAAAKKIDDDGRLIVETNGEKKTLSFGEVHLKIK